MKIIIDNSNLFAGGGIQVATSFLYDLNSLNLDHQFHVIQSFNSSKQIEKTDFLTNFHFYDLNDEISSSIFRRSQKVKSIEKLIIPNVIFTIFGPSYYKSDYPKIIGFALPDMIYKNSPFFSQISLKKKIFYKFIGIFKRFAFIRNSDVLIFETDEARKIFMSTVSKKIESYTVSNTLNEIFFNKKKWKNCLYPSKTDFEILCLSANYPHKNLQIIPKIIDKLVKDFSMINFRFVLTLNKDELGFPDRYDNFIHYIGKVDIKQIPSLYQKIDFVIIPTLLELFSTTYLEAMHMGKPLICSDMGFARYICHDAAIYCNPMNPSEYASAIHELSRDKILQMKLVDHGYENVKRFGTSMDRSMGYLKIIEKFL